MIHHSQPDRREVLIHIAQERQNIVELEKEKAKFSDCDPAIIAQRGKITHLLLSSIKSSLDLPYSPHILEREVSMLQTLAIKYTGKSKISFFEASQFWNHHLISHLLYHIEKVSTALAHLKHLHGDNATNNIRAEFGIGEDWDDLAF
jgi:hypothetical protein